MTRKRRPTRTTEDAAKLAAENEELRQQLEAHKAQLATVLAAEPPEQEYRPTKEEKALIAAGCKAYGIGEQYVFAARVRYDDGNVPTALIVTNGGAKVRYGKTMKDSEIVPLEAVGVNGIVRRKMKPVAGRAK